jgi:membrane protein required for colicin V production
MVAAAAALRLRRRTGKTKPVNWLDLLLVAVIGLVAYRGYSNGFIRELVSIAAVILAIPIAGVLYDDMYPKVEPIVTNQDLAAVVSFVSILAGVIIGGQVVAHLLKRTAEVLNLGFLDAIAGGVFGFAKAVIVAQVLLILLVRYPQPDVRGSIDDSPVANALLDAAPVVLAFLPGTFGAGLDLFRDATNALNGNGN